METQRILVTGGSGFIGTNLVNELRSRGHEVLSVDLLHHEDEADLYSDSYSDYVRGDIRNYRQMERILMIMTSLTMFIIWLQNMVVGMERDTMKIFGKPM